MDRAMSLMRRAAIFFVSLVLTTTSAIAAGGADLEHADLDYNNLNSLQRGARNFMNYCSGCHSAQYVRFKTIGRNLELSEELLIENLMFNAEKTFEAINASMRPEDAQRWFGTAPPDLSLMARARGADYIYTFLKSYYVDDESPTGVDNIVLAGTSMPNVLWELQGFQSAVFDEHVTSDAAGNEIVSLEFDRFEQVVPGSMDADEFDDFVRDTTNFLAYIAEPARSDRRKLGVWVLMYLAFFLIIATMLKKQIWKDVK